MKYMDRSIPETVSQHIGRLREDVVQDREERSKTNLVFEARFTELEKRMASMNTSSQAPGQLSGDRSRTNEIVIGGFDQVHMSKEGALRSAVEFCKVFLDRMRSFWIVLQTLQVLFQ